MSDTQALLERIAGLRIRLTGPTTLPIAGDEPPAVGELVAEVEASERVGQLLDGSLRQIAGALEGEDIIRPSHLTSRARRALQRGRELVCQLRRLADDPSTRLTDPDDPVAQSLRQTASMTETAVRMVQAFPDAATAQLRLCDGLDGILQAIADRVGQLQSALVQRLGEQEQIGGLADLLGDLQAGSLAGIEPLNELAETLIDEARNGDPLRWSSPGPMSPASDAASLERWRVALIAGHGLNTARVLVRLTRHNILWRDDPVTPALAGLLHDAGMLALPAELLAQASPLDDGQRRQLEAHARIGATWIEAAFPDLTALAEAVAQHHERMDGTGYPAGLRGGHCGHLARVLMVADVYAAQSVSRPHRAALDPRTALTDTLLLAERGLLDRDAAEGLLGLAFYPVGTVVELLDGSVARVIANHPPRPDLHAPARPVLELLTDDRGQLLSTPRHLDLAQADGPAILRAVSATKRRQLFARRYPLIAG